MEMKALQIDGVGLRQPKEGADSPQRHRDTEGIDNDGKAIAMVGWGHLLLPFFIRPRSGGARRGESGESCLLDRRRGGGPVRRASLRPATLRRASLKSGTEYTVADELSSVIIKDWLTVRTARESRKRSLVTIEPITNCHHAGGADVR